MLRIGIADTMFARVNMGAIALKALADEEKAGEVTLIRRTVPGFKDLPAAAKIMIHREGCGIVVACGMPGGQPIDQQCAHEASLGLIWCQLMTNTPILEVFVHENEAGGDDAKLLAIARDRTAKHARNAFDMLAAPDTLIARAGQGVRQGAEDAGPVMVEAKRKRR